MILNNSSVIGKILIHGELVLKSPLLIGDGEGETSDNFKDIHVQKNQAGKPFIPGTSLAGALREYFTKINSAPTEKIFGDLDKMQSSIQIEDIELENFEIVSRDGVSIDGFTGIGIKGGKFDYEVVERGAKGKLQMQINLRGCHVDENFTDKNYTLDKIKTATADILQKLSAGINLGALTSKGFGKIQVSDIVAEIFDFRKKADVISWLTDKKSAEKILPTEKAPASADDFIVDADFIFNNSFIVRDYLHGEKNSTTTISAVSLKNRNDFVIPGTSWKGIFRHRAEYILRKLGLENKILDKLMGTAEDEKIKSRLMIEESYITPENVADIIHTRNKIDRFTGGTLQGTLFTTKPVWQKKFAPTLHLHFEVKDCKNFDAGLMLFILRDLWLGKIALGGEKSVGRGTLTGLNAEIKFKDKIYQLGEGGKIISGDKNELEKFSSAVRGD